MLWLWWISWALAGQVVDLDLGGHVYHPVWSEDGQILLVEVNRHKDQADLALLRLDSAGEVSGSQRVRLPGARNPFSGSEPVAMNPVWVGEGFLFEATDARGHFRIYRGDREGGSAPWLDEGTLGGNLTFPTQVGGAGAVISDVSGVGQLYQVDGAEVRQLTAGPVPEMFPMLSEDGQRLVFSRKVGQTEDLFVYDLRRDQERGVAGGAGDQTRPRWVGERLVFFDEARGPGRWDLVVREPDGAVRVLGRDVRLPVRSRPAVSPDGRWVAYAAEGERLVVVALDGPGRVEVQAGQQRVGEPALGQRDGRTWLAWTGLPAEGAGYRQLVLKELTQALDAAR